MGYASGFSCHTLATDAATEACSRLTFGYSGGVASCTGATVVDDVATMAMSYTPAGGVATTTNTVLQLQPCEEVTTDDAVLIGWMLVLLCVSLAAFALMKRAAR